MIVYDLVCAQKHRFEGWFASSDDYERQRGESMVRCPICDDAEVSRQPSANIQTGRAPEPASAQPAATAPSPQDRTGAMLHALRQMIAQTEDVGGAFSEQARKMHYEEIEKRSIRGKATAEEANSLREEGIEFMPVPDILARDLN